MRKASVTVINNLDASISQVSSTVQISQIFNASLQAIVTGLSSGSLQVQVSNDPPAIAMNEGTPKPVNWTDFGSPLAVSGAGTYLMPQFDLCYMYMQVVYTSNNGSAGTIMVNAAIAGV